MSTAEQYCSTPEAVLQYWFVALTPQDWWRKDAQLDATIAHRFGTTLDAARRGELSHWRDADSGRLAEVLVLDQFSRHIHRDTALAFAADSMALVLAQEALRQGVAAALEPSRKAFLYMPFMHSESLLMQREALRLFSEPGLEDNLRFARAHYDIIARFQRFPHRNRILGRPSTQEEVAFLRTPGSRF